jgi:hypothetical protein
MLESLAVEVIDETMTLEVDESDALESLDVAVADGVISLEELLVIGELGWMKVELETTDELDSLLELDDMKDPAKVVELVAVRVLVAASVEVAE